MKKTVCVFLIFVIPIALAGEKLTEFPDLLKPTSLQIFDGRIFITEGHGYRVYSLKDYKLLQKIGRKGEGPGEFNLEIKLRIAGDKYLAVSPFKFAWFSKDGDYISEHRIPGVREVYPVKKNYVILRERIDRQNKKVFRTAFLIDSNLKNPKELYTGELDINVRAFQEKARLLLHTFDLQCDDDRIYIVDTKKGFHIQVFDGRGEELYVIKKNLGKIKTPSRLKSRVIKEFEMSNPRAFHQMKSLGFQFPPYLPAIRFFSVSDRKIHVITYGIKRDGHELIILDLKGNILKTAYIPLQTFEIKKSIFDYFLYTFKENQAYELVENEEKDVWELHRYDLD